MAIATVIQSGNAYQVKDERGAVLNMIPGGPGTKLLGYTATTVSIQRQNSVYVYGPRGQVLNVSPA